MSSNTKKLVITSGEPAGIGPDIILKIAQQPHDACLIILGDQSVFESRAKALNLDVTIKLWSPGSECLPHKPGQVLLYHVPVVNEVVAGKLDNQNSNYVLKLLEVACDGCLDNTFDAMVTAPVHKGVICESGYHLVGILSF